MNLKTWGLRLAVVALVTSVSAGCDSMMSMVDPTHGMTPEEKQAYHAKKEAERKAREEERRRKEAAFRARSPKDLTTPGEGHDGQFNRAFVGRWSENVGQTKWVSVVLFDEKEGWREWQKELTLFDNGSYAYRLTKDRRWGEDSKGRDWSMEGAADLSTLSSGGSKVGEIERGQWKTGPYTFANPETGQTVNAEALYFRADSMNGYGPWRYIGVAELSGSTLGVAHEKNIKEQTDYISKAKANEYTPLKLIQAIRQNTMMLKRR